jgi:hypothetical protein
MGPQLRISSAPEFGHFLSLNPPVNRGDSGVPT